MRLIVLVLVLMLTVPAAPARADIVVLANPDPWIEQALKDISQGKTDEFARNYVKLIDKADMLDYLADNLRVLSRMGAPEFMEKVSDQKHGTALREVVYLALYSRANYIYFKFVMKKNRSGWLITNFAFKDEASQLFPKGFVGPQ